MRKPMFVMAILSGLLALSVTGQGQQQDGSQQKCINALNKAAGKVLSVQGKVAANCRKDFSNGKSSAATCIAADTKQKVADAMAKTLKAETDKCVVAPGFAAGSSGLEAANANLEASENALGLVYELLGDDIDAGTRLKAANKAQAACQGAVMKAAQKCLDTKLKVFNKCKQDGLMGKVPPGPIDDAQSLEDLCFQAILDDAKGNIGKKCAGVAGQGLDGALAKKCTEKGVAGSSLEDTFAGVVPPITVAELDRIVECQACVYLNAVDGLARDCDFFDNGLVDASCGVSTPPTTLPCVPNCTGLDCGDDGCGGSCGTCSLANATSQCVAGACDIVSCQAPFDDCDSIAANGCEADTDTSLSHCGGCNSLCSLANATEYCSGGLCLLGACNSGFASCDANTGNGCEINHASVTGSCSTPSYMGSMSGDRACGFICGLNTGWDPMATRTGRTSAWFSATVVEASDCPTDIEHRITLTSPAGANYDLYVYRPCGTLVASSTNGTGATDQVIIQQNDNVGSLDTFTYYIEVRYYSGSSCSSWSLNVYGHIC